MRKDDGCREVPVQEMTEEEKKAANEATERFFKLVFGTSQEEAEEMFDSGIFNGIAIGYAKFALDQMGKPVNLEDFEREMERAFDYYKAKEARKRYQSRG